MNLLERTRAAQGLCTRCGRCEPYPGLLTCRDCTERIVAPRWRQKLPARDETGWTRAA